MKKTSLLFIIAILPGLLGFAPLPSGASRAKAAPDLSTFGYVVTTPALSWTDIASEENRISQIENLNGSLDDGYIAYSLPFSFSFFEYAYDQAWISTNGMIMLTGSDLNLSGNSAKNEIFPIENQPNNVIAPYWDDLTLIVDESGPETGIFAKFESNPADHLTIQWNALSFEDNELMIFQAVLWASGDVDFNYHTLDGAVTSATVGLEDSDGLDGVLTYFDEAGLASGQSIHYAFPGAPRHGAKLSLHSSGKFTQNYSAEISLWLRNTGTESDDFILEYNINDQRASGGSWEVLFFEEDGVTPIPSAGGMAAFGSLSAGDTRSFIMRVTLNNHGVNPAGDFARIYLDAYPSSYPAGNFTAAVQVAVPAPFAQALVDSAAGMTLQFNRPSALTSVHPYNYFTGSTLTLGGASLFGYVFAWEHQLRETDRANVEYSMASSLSNIVSEKSQITGENLAIQDKYPKVAITNNQRIAFLYLRSDYTIKGNSLWNLRLAILDSTAQVVLKDVNVTNNTIRENDSSGVNFNGAPTIIATQDNRLILIWKKSVKAENVTNTDLWMAIYNSEGKQLVAPKAITSSQSDGVNYADPDLTELPNGKFLLLYTIYDVNDNGTLAYRLVDTDGTVSATQTYLAGAEGERPECAVLTNGYTVVAWTHGDRIGFAVLDDQLDVTNAPDDLPEVNEQHLDKVSAARYGDSAILTWGDTANRLVYYALVGWDGGLITPPMIFYQGQDPIGPMVYLSDTGEGISPLVDTRVYKTYLPLFALSKK